MIKLPDKECCSAFQHSNRLSDSDHGTRSTYAVYSSTVRVRTRVVYYCSTCVHVYYVRTVLVLHAHRWSVPRHIIIIVIKFLKYCCFTRVVVVRWMVERRSLLGPASAIRSHRNQSRSRQPRRLQPPAAGATSGTTN